MQATRVVAHGPAAGGGRLPGAVHYRQLVFVACLGPMAIRTMMIV
jgi:hypothetical protein